MDTDRVSRWLLAVAGVLAVAIFLLQAGFLSAPWGPDRATVTIVGPEGNERATVEAEVADSWSERYTGLSDHENLSEDEGMLFVHEREGERTYVMRNMDFGIDIIFVDADRSVTTIHEAPEPAPDEDGSEQTYEGQAKWVLEVPYGYADEHDITVGDEIEIDDA
ncbi:DUF192 domain-containing protein [Halobacteria archaeon AArc-dxtr1]|nr:DUF192 domain-containing protein [Halobacteria archaeon AArc-dxtr1]